MALIALLTDFGTRDPYVAAMKGVIGARCDARIEDLTHEIAPFDVFGAAWFLRSVVEYWPAGTIFVAVVDPGVGTARRIVAAEKNGRVFLAPDNGVCASRMNYTKPRRPIPQRSRPHSRARSEKKTRPRCARQSRVCPANSGKLLRS